MAIVSCCRVIGDCPICGGEACFGNVMVGGSTLSRGCRLCAHWVQIPLPVLKKKILYLDQSFLSSAFRMGKPPLVEVFKKVSNLASKQLLVTPHSDIHEDETYAWSGYSEQTPEQLMRFIKTVARGLKFKPQNEVEKEQIFRAFKAFMAGEPATNTLLKSDIFYGDQNEWHDYMYVSVQRPPIDLNGLRQQKARSSQQMLDAFKSWRNTSATFEEDVAFEIQDASRIYLQHYLQSLCQMMNGDAPDIFSATAPTEKMRMLVSTLTNNMSGEDALQKVSQFLSSQHFALMPHLTIAAGMFAQLRQQARTGAYSNREKAMEKLGGTLDDVRHIATYAPYCDAIFVDNAMADLVAKALDADAMNRPLIVSFMAAHLEAGPGLRFEVKRHKSTTAVRQRDTESGLRSGIKRTGAMP